MKANYPCLHLSAGELLRAETTKEESPHKELIENCLVSGNIVPVEISLSLLEAAMKEAADAHGKSLLFLVDGFPRNFDNLHGWIKCMNRTTTVWGVLNYACPLEELERRILNRAKDSGRSDDNLASARKRFATFERETVPVVDTLRQVQELLTNSRQPSLQVFDIRADQTVEAVWQETQNAMNQMISNDVLTAHTLLLEAIQTKNVDLYRQLCAKEWFTDKSAEQVMTKQEGDAVAVGPVSNVKISYISGTKVAIECDRVLPGDVVVQEKRIWSHQGKEGWKNIHFARLPLQQ
jgi:UMP-CMP kinase